VLRMLTLSAAVLALTACSTPSAAKAKSCNGSNRRPANVHGSVLPGSPVPAVTAPTPAPPMPGPNGKPAKQAETTPGPRVPAPQLKQPTKTYAPASKPRKVSAITATFPSCA